MGFELDYDLLGGKDNVFLKKLSGNDLSGNIHDILKLEKHKDEKYLDVKSYGDIYRNKSLLFHGIAFKGVLNIYSILEKGILNRKELTEEGKIFGETISSGGVDHVSVSKSPIDNYYIPSLGKQSSFRIYNELNDSSIVFIIDKDGLDIRAKGFNGLESEFYDEIFVKGNIKPNKIKGIIINELLLTEKNQNVNGVEQLGVFFFQDLKEKYGIKIYNKKGFEINI